MGVQDLWPILEPVSESVPLYSLSGKTLAVDLSLWVCEAQHVQAMMGRVTKPHLRNLFFRVSSLTLMGVKLVFVMEGEAPKLKAETMSKRIEGRYGGFKKSSAPKVPSKTSRGRFNTVLRECSEMLDYMGVPWVTAAGEAEAMCAYLDSQGLVDGCITNDGDAFLYGARTVYRNFNMNSKDPQVDCYRMSRVERELQLSRENMVGLAILLGCDYIPKGVAGVGKEQAVKFIQTLKGQSLLLKFTQWKENNPCLFEGAAKKVSHCNLCRHPGSAKAHERGGCVFCDSTRFCQPQDFDYQCPCDWHRHERTRQALSLEANIRKRTVANDQFPFTEIIKEFLVSKDKPVSQFRRRQPNMLSLQKFAYDKMEWPQHYTSEKVLVLMTYTELMNRKHGRDACSLIRPVRILKPRVRNAVACFEVIWRTPDHYVFPEDHPTEGENEVRTVEEESLVRAAFPDVVESYLRDKALAEENKTKKKKPKRIKEKPSDVSDDITDLLSQMSLQQQAESTEKAEVVLLDTPVNRRRRSRSKERDPNSLDFCAGTPLSDSAAAATAAAASPSVSAVIDALHLSDIDWEALSFTSSPASHVAKNHSIEPELDSHVADDIGEENSETFFTDCPLRDRVLMKNTVKAAPQNTVVPKEQNISPPNSHLQANIKGKESNVSKKEPLRNKNHGVGINSESQTRSRALSAKDLPTEKENVPKKPPPKYKFVRTATLSSMVSSSSSSAPKQRCNSDPCPNSKGGKVSQTTKKSVCVSVRSSSEDSDAEDQQQQQRKTKMKPTHRVNTDAPLRLVPLSKTVKNTMKPTDYQRLKLDVSKDSTPVSTGSKSPEVPRAAAVRDVSFPSPASPAASPESDDSVICSDSPLPLAERLRLKFLK